MTGGNCQILFETYEEKIFFLIISRLRSYQLWYSESEISVKKPNNGKKKKNEVGESKSKKIFCVFLLKLIFILFFQIKFWLSLLGKTIYKIEYHAKTLPNHKVSLNF